MATVNILSNRSYFFRALLGLQQNRTGSTKRPHGQPDPPTPMRGLLQPAAERRRPDHGQTYVGPADSRPCAAHLPLTLGATRSLGFDTRVATWTLHHGDTPDSLAAREILCVPPAQPCLPPAPPTRGNR